MNPRARRRLPWRTTALLLAGGCLWAGFLGSRHLEGRGSVIDRAESVLADLRLMQAGRRGPPDSVMIAAIDDATVAAAGGYPLDRRYLADIVRAAGEAGARAVAIDLLLIDKGEEEPDATLAAALASVPSVIAGAGRFAPDDLSRQGLPVTVGELLPLPSFARVSSVGLVNVSADAGGTPRHLPLVFRATTGLMPSFALRAAGLHAGADPVLGANGIRVGGAERRLDLGWHLPLRYFGPQATVHTVPARDLIKDPAVAARARGRVVVLGATATGVGDRFATPFDGVLPGVEVLATGIAHLIDGSGLLRDPAVRRIDAGATAALMLAGVLAIALLPLLAGAGLFAGLTALWLAAITVLFAQGWWFSAALPLAGSLPPVAAAAIVRQRFDRGEARRAVQAREVLGSFQAPVLAQRIADDPDFLRVPREQRVAVLFIDLAGFTGMSERLGPAGAREVLKAFHSLVVTESEARGGLVMSFMGDGAMIVFGVPDEGEDDAGRALAAAFALVASVRQWIGDADLGGDLSDVRIGAHCGPVVLSRLGHDRHQHITTTGDAVNVASRLMEVGKERAGTIVASADMLARAGPMRAAGAPEILRDVPIRGRQQGLDVAIWRIPADAAA